MRVFEARTGQAEVVEAMVQRNAGHGDAQAVHLGEVGQAQAAWLMDLTEDDVTLFAVNGPPAADAPLQRATHPGGSSG